MWGLFKQIGRATFKCVNTAGGITQLAVQTVFCIFTPPFERDLTLKEMRRAGIESLFIVSVVAVFTGMILALQTAYQMQKLSAEIYIANIVSLSLVRELGPVLTALIVAGRVGAAIAAEIGTMNVTEQVDALRTMATDPIRYLVVPRFLALALMLPVLTMYADLIGILGGYGICVYRLHINSLMYTKLTFDALVFKDLFTGLTKTVFFGMIIAIVASYEGLKTEGGAEGVGKATTTAVVAMFISIIAADCFFTALFYFIFP